MAVLETEVLPVEEEVNLIEPVVASAVILVDAVDVLVEGVVSVVDCEFDALVDDVDVVLEELVISVV